VTGVFLFFVWWHMTGSGRLAPASLKKQRWQAVHRSQYVAVKVACRHNASLSAHRPMPDMDKAGKPNLEAVMQTNKPTPQQLRNYLAARHDSKSAPPAPAEIRRQLGWGLVQQVRDTGR